MAVPYMLLTGASRGIGHATVKLFQEKGWRILTVSRQPFSEECRWPSARESHIQADLEDLSRIDDLADEVRSRLPEGKLAALVNNAGISPKGEGGSRLGVMDTTAEIWTRVLNVNLVSTALLARALLPELEAAKGSIVNVTSIVGSRVHPFAGVAYATSKAALAALTRELAHEFGPRGVRANAIAPGEINTAILSPERPSWWKPRCRSGGSAPRPRWRRPSISSARNSRATSTARKFTSMADSTSDTPSINRKWSLHR